MIFNTKSRSKDQSFGVIIHLTPNLLSFHPFFFNNIKSILRAFGGKYLFFSYKLFLIYNDFKIKRNRSIKMYE